jgi:cytoskeletal protein CcmA (bactofilin family)
MLAGRRTVLPALALVAVLGVAAAQQQPARPPGVVVGGSYAVVAGQTVRGDLVAIGASVVIEAGATLDGALTVVGGSTVVDGLVTGAVHAYGGALSLGSSARVLGDLSSNYAAYDPTAGSRVEGTVQAGNEPPVRFALPADVGAPAGLASRAVAARNPADAVVRSLALGLVAALLMAALPLRVGRVRDTMLHHPARAGLDGFVTFVVAVLILVLLAVTLIGIPLAIAGGALLYATVLFGLIAFGDAVGSALAARFEQTWSAPMRAGVGTFSVSVGLLVLQVIPVLGGLAGFLLALVALGAVRSTRFGGREPRSREPAAAAPQGG